MEQIHLWVAIEARLEELVSTAIARIQAPPDMPPGNRFLQKDLSLREVRLEPGGVVELFFDTPLGDELDMWPMVRFLDWNLQDSDWVP